MNELVAEFARTLPLFTPDAVAEIASILSHEAEEIKSAMRAGAIEDRDAIEEIDANRRMIALVKNRIRH